MEPNTPSVQEFETDLHISAAILDIVSLPAKSKKVIQVYLSQAGNEFVIANLCHQTTQFALDIGFSKGEKVTFFTKGEGNVHLHGYFVPEDKDGNRYKLFNC